MTRIMNNEAIAYVTGLNINTYPRPLFIKRALGDSLKLYRLRTIIGHLRGEDEFTDVNINTEDVMENYVNNALHAGKNLIYMLPRVHDCVRIDRVDEFTALSIESLYVPFFRKIRERTVIILNTVGALAAMSTGKRVVIDLMDLWSCSAEGLRLNALDYHVLRRAWQVWAWSRAITALLRRIGISNVRYVPFGIDLGRFDPMRVSTSIFFERYRDLEGKVLIGYSGGMWIVNGKERIGVEKIIRAFKLIEDRVKGDAVLVMQTSRSVIPMIKKYGIRNYVYISQTRFNDPFRLSLLRAMDIKVLTATKYLPVYLSERTTMFQYMTSEGAIIAEKTPGVLGVLKHMYNAYMVNLGDVNAMAQAMLELVNDRKLRNYLGGNARKDIETKYNINVISHNIRKYLELN
ncbi:glycosyltransferase [Vulcanisaeta distributa]|uniref:Glycosyl transferase group 1 n=1 Tax=Vulcanisaeta distributa (strain DSM 14429 / JCM 11212 / NBRC 100878 / IC-017) TaxID=572478 RepID=E1QP91_VULDI|nr:glycosyltransferase [Vulcanisaeta distributa]ADN50262.1 glycosyl transferase group 1 [Vulcanisaeta distributa DSM 14429]